MPPNMKVTIEDINWTKLMIICWKCWGKVKHLNEYTVINRELSKVQNTPIKRITKALGSQIKWLTYKATTHILIYCTCYQNPNWVHEKFFSPKPKAEELGFPGFVGPSCSKSMGGLKWPLTFRAHKSATGIPSNSKEKGNKTTISKNLVTKNYTHTYKYAHITNKRSIYHKNTFLPLFFFHALFLYLIPTTFYNDPFIS